MSNSLCQAHLFVIKLNQFPIFRLFGLIEFQQAVLFIREPEIIYRILVKDFAKFADHSSFIDEKTDILFGSCLLMLKGKKWHDMRSTLSPTFTASKMRTMFDMMLDCANVTTNHILKQTENGNTANWEMKEFFMRYGNDVMCSCLYGVTVDSMKKADNSNSFLTNGRNVLKFNSTKVVIRTALIKMWPKLMKSLGIAVMENSCLNFFRTTVLDSIRVREENDIYRPDMINILQKVKREQSKNILSEEHKETTVLKSEWSDDEIMAQVFIFYFAGFDSSSNILMFLAYELALNPDVQDTLYNEIRKFHENSGGKNITYDTIGSMKYLDQSIKETLRKWPAVTLTDRCCLHDFEVDIGKEKPLIIKKDSVLWIPMYALHHDPQYYPEPEKFDPSRFSDENKGNIVPGTFLGFGIGPRSCIGKLNLVYFYLSISLNIFVFGF